MLTKNCLTINNRTVYYWERNPSATRTIIFIHGFRGNHKALTDISSYYEDARTIILDLPGYGLSDNLPGRHTIKNYADFLHSFVQALSLTKFDLIGHSYGGSIAIVYASKYPEGIDHLILISPAIPIDSISQTLATIQLTIMRTLPKKWQKRWLSSPVIEFLSTMSQVKTVTRKRKLEMFYNGLKNAKEQRPNVIIECLDSFLTTPFFQYASLISSPTFILAGEADMIAPLKTQVMLSEQISMSRIEYMPKIGHLAPLERPLTVGRLIDQLTGHQPEKQSHVHYLPTNTLTTQPRGQKIL